MKTELKQLKAELESELFDNILSYWKNNTIDEKNGGFIGSINGQNVPDYNAPKGIVLNSRILWTFASAYRIFKKQDDLDIAKRAFQYIAEYFVDKKYGGVYWEIDYKGKPTNPRKQIYGLSFTIYGLVEYYRVCSDESALETAIDLFNLIEKHSFDKKRNGYIEALTEEWNKMDDYRLSEKDANESKTMNTHLHILEAYTNLYRVWKNDNIKRALKNLIELFIDKFINDNYNLNLFFDDDWNLKSDMISFGHDIECSWLLYEAAEVLGNLELIQKVSSISVKMSEVTFKGLDNDGGLMNEDFPSKQHLDTDKHWWPQAEAIVGFYNTYELTNDEFFLQKAIDSWEFTKKHIVDNIKGEWFGRVDKNGVVFTDDEKAGFWKCPYHNSRACMEIVERVNKIED